MSDFSRHRRGAVIVDMFGMCAARKFIIPRRRLIPALSCGGAISSIAFTFDGSGLVPSGVTMVPRYLTYFILATIASPD